MLQVLNGNHKLITVLDQEISEVEHIEQLNGTNSLTFKMTITEDKQVYEGNYIGFKDLDGNYQLFEIAQIEDSHEEEQTVEVYCEHLAYELNDVVILEKTLTGNSCASALGFILSGTRWQVGTVTASGNKNMAFGNTNAMKALNDILTKWKAEVKFRAVLNDNLFTFFIDIGPRGTTTGKRFEYGKDMVKITRRVDTTQVKSHLYGFGKTIDASSVLEVAASAGATTITVKEGTHFNYVHRITIGSSPVERVEVQKVIGKVIYLEQPLANSFAKGTKVITAGSKLTFSEAIWTTPTYPYDKPLGRKYVNVTPWNGRARWGIYETDIDNPVDLLEATWDELQRIKDPLLSYEMQVLDLEKLAGYSHEKVRLGDTVTVIDKVIQPNITIQARVIEIKRNLIEPEKNEVILGNFVRAIYDDAKRLADAENRLKNIGSDKLVPGEPIPTSVLDGVIDALQNEVKSTGGYVYLTDADGILITDAPKDSNPTKAMRLKGGIIAIANSKLGDGSWNWRTFGTGDGFTADLITSGTILADRIAAQSLVITKLDGTTQAKIINGDSAKTTLTAKESGWDSTKSTVDNNAGSWNSAANSVSLNSAYWNTAYNQVVDWRHPADYTTIDGGKIRAGTIVGDRIYGGTIQGTIFVSTTDAWSNKVIISDGEVKCTDGNGYTCGGFLRYSAVDVSAWVSQIQLDTFSTSNAFNGANSHGILTHGNVGGTNGLIYRGVTQWKLVMAD